MDSDGDGVPDGCDICLGANDATVNFVPCCEQDGAAACLAQCQSGSSVEPCKTGCLLGSQQSCELGCFGYDDLLSCSAACDMGNPQACVSGCWLGSEANCAILCAGENPQIYDTNLDACSSQVCLATGCPGTYFVGDGECHPACNNDVCNFDGGDCN